MAALEPSEIDHVFQREYGRAVAVLVRGLLALMLLVESRRAARTTPAGDMVLRSDQDRARWDRAQVAEGQAIVRACLRGNRPGPYQIQAAINAVHSAAPTAAATDWWQAPAPGPRDGGRAGVRGGARLHGEHQRARLP